MLAPIHLNIKDKIMHIPVNKSAIKSRMKLKISNSFLPGLFNLVLLSGFLLCMPEVCSALVPEEVKKKDIQEKDGKLLRSELWQPFNASKAKGDFFLSPVGNDDWSGTLPEPNATKSDGPFATITRAMRAVRELKAKVYLPKGKAIDARYVGSSYPFGKGKDIVVFIRQGFYTLQEPLLFNPEDGGERVETNLPSGAFEWHHLRDNYVTYSAYPGERPVISGAVAATGWEKGKNNIWKAPFKNPDVPVLIMNGKKQTLARTPNTGYFTLRKTPASTFEIPFKPGDIKKWKDMQDNRIAILLRWRTAYNTIDRIDEKQQIAFLKNAEDGPGGNNGLLVVPPRYYIENIKALLDAPGEWFYDKNREEINYIPAEGLSNPNQAALSIPHLTQLVQVKGTENKPVRNLRFYGLIFEGAKENFRNYPHHYEPTPGCIAISYEYTSDCEFANSELRACSGVGMSIGQGCFQTRIFRNTFNGLEQGALSVSSTGDLKTGKLSQLTRETNIDHNIFSECGLGGGITLGISGTLHTTIAHNYFTKSGRPYTIDCGAGGLEGGVTEDCVVEYNHFEDVQQDADDAGVTVVTGMTFHSTVRNNLIHKVHRGFFSDNVAFWFDNMSSNWAVTNNLYYDLEQGEMKTCGTYLTDNIYSGNFTIEPPLLAPEQFIEGDPQLCSSNLHITMNGKPVEGAIAAGSLVKVTAEVTNIGSSGAAPVTLYLDRKIVENKAFPVIRNNVRTIVYELRVSEPGRHEISIGETNPQAIEVSGERPAMAYDQIRCSEERILAGEKVCITALATNLLPVEVNPTLQLFANGIELKTIQTNLKGKESKEVSFDLTPKAGSYRIRIGNSEEVLLRVLKCKELNLTEQKLFTYISPKAQPARVELVPKENRYLVKASGWDFYHAEDAYATVYLKQLEGDFISTVKIRSFGPRTSEWYRSGLFVRNNLSQSFDVDRGSLGSVLMFSTPGRAGIEYDEFGNGCMHKATSENLPENSSTPVWIRLERHGDRFTGYISLDGQKWIIRKQTNQIPGIGKAIDLGLAAGSPDQKQYSVEFGEWTIKVIDE